MKVKQDVSDLRIETTQNGFVVYEDATRSDPYTQSAIAKRWVFSSFAELVYFLDEHFIPASIDSLNKYPTTKEIKQCVKDGRLFRTSCKDTNPWAVDNEIYGGGS